MTSFTFNEFGQQLTRTLPEVAGQPTATESMSYNGFGQLLTSTDFNGQVARYFYDTDAGYADPQNPELRLGRLTATEYYPLQFPTGKPRGYQVDQEDHPR